VRVVGPRVGVHQVFEHVARFDLIDALNDVLVALAQDIGGLWPGLAGEHEREGVVHDPLLPQLVHVRLARRPCRVVAVEVVAGLGVPLRLRLQQIDRVLHPLPVALFESLEDEKSGVDVPGVDHVVELALIDRELLHVARQEIAVLGIEELQVALEHLPGEGIVDGLTAVMRLFEDSADLAGDRALLVGRRKRPGRQDRSGACRSAQGGVRGGEHENREDGEGEPSKRTAEGLEHLKLLAGSLESGEDLRRS
jgi:hypothetical protein